MSKRFWRDFGPYILIFTAGGGAVLLAERSGNDAWRVVAVCGFVGAVAAWAVYDFFRDDPGEPDPFGRSMRQAITHSWAAKGARKSQLIWTPATVQNCPGAIWKQLSDAIELEPQVIALDGELTWLAAERDWWGWPDPPRYVVVAFNAGGELVAAGDFNKWPARWNRPAGLATD